ncbi:putative RTA1 domain protein [Aspergillus japonicus CBS 114.51]|uniref:Putative RTA1 domain protein n=1 Tax=Aspergillus japonicus CBS 114.51 TaxID=1448312 RepID=A0A8T8X433_ASPJA|nr:putative RTA1 domain protein [Aspergillus japonicus CBS 114.51]RAH82402.1 putative RTA1 domain protein [Aspergillus japonicus CBS 114.51]
MSTNNATTTDTSTFVCTLQTCSLDYAMIHYIPSLAGNALFLALFCVAAVVHLFLGVWHRTTSYLVAVMGGLLLEIIGYAGRISLHEDPFSFNAFLQYLICLTLGPAFISAGIYLCFGRVVIEYDPRCSRLAPATYSKVFIACDLVCLILQSAGGAITSTAGTDNTSLSDLGINIMIAGLACQVVSLVAFMALAGDFALRMRRHQTQGSGSLLPVDWHAGWKWRGFLISLVVATTTIFIRSCFRVAELKGGFGSALANDQVAFMVLEGVMMILACGAMTAFHPGLVFSRERWNASAQQQLKLQRVETGSSQIEMVQRSDV